MTSERKINVTEINVTETIGKSYIGVELGEIGGFLEIRETCFMARSSAKKYEKHVSWPGAPLRNTRNMFHGQELR